jgi:hypothetical protein
MRPPLASTTCVQPIGGSTKRHSCVPDGEYTLQEGGQQRLGAQQRDVTNWRPAPSHEYCSGRSAHARQRTSTCATRHVALRVDLEPVRDAALCHGKDPAICGVACGGGQIESVAVQARREPTSTARASRLTSTARRRGHLGRSRVQSQSLCCRASQFPAHS